MPPVPRLSDYGVAVGAATVAVAGTLVAATVAVAGTVVATGVALAKAGVAVPGIAVN